MASTNGCGQPTTFRARGICEDEFRAHREDHPDGGVPPSGTRPEESAGARHRVRMGAFQSWRFAMEGFNVVATELNPEFLFAADRVVADAYFERVIADGTVLPFANGSFDVIFCKEFIHHLPQPAELLRELWRVAAPGAILAVREPCLSVLMSKKRQRERDPAVKVESLTTTTRFTNTCDTSIT